MGQASNYSLAPLSVEQRRWLVTALWREERRYQRAAERTRRDKARFEAGDHQSHYTTPSEYASTLKRGLERSEYGIRMCRDIIGMLITEEG